MADNVLESYFIKVAALTDAASFLRLGQVLKSVDLGISGLAKTTIGTFVAIETASLSTFGAIGVGLINMADNAARTDQSYRLFGLRMLMTKESARALQITLHELGDVSLDQVAFDPELNKRFQELYEQNIKLNKVMGEGYDKAMFNIRTLRVDYEKFSNELGLLANVTVQKLFDKLGFGNKDFLKTLDDLNSWFISEIPEISDMISNDLIPVWKEFKVVMADAWGDVKLLGKEWQTMSGIILGDTSIQNQEVSIKSLVKTMGDWLDMITKVSLGISLWAKTGLHIAAGSMMEMASSIAYMRGDKAEGDRLDKMQAEEGRAAKMDLSDLWKNAQARMTGTSFDGDPNNPDYASFEAYKKSKSNNDSDQFDMSDFGPAFDKNRLPVARGDLNNYTKMIRAAAMKYAVDPDRLMALMLQESGGRNGLTSPKGAQGLMQIMPETGKKYGLKDPFDPKQNIEAGAHLFSDLMRRYNGDQDKAEMAYNAGIAAVDSGKAIKFPETQNYYRSIDAMTDKMHAANGTTISIGSLTITVPHSLPEDQWKPFVADSIKQAADKATRNTTAQVAGGAFF